MCPMRPYGTPRTVNTYHHQFNIVPALIQTMLLLSCLMPCASCRGIIGARLL